MSDEREAAFEVGLQVLHRFEADRDAQQAFVDAGAPLAGVYYCPHHPSVAVGPYRRECDCRKPAPGMLLEAARALRIDLAKSVLFGDRASDLEAARAAGVPHRVLLATDGAGDPSGVAQELATARAVRLDLAVNEPEFVRRICAEAR